MPEQPIGAEKADLTLEIAHLLFIDVVSYSKLLVNEQIELMQQLNRIVRTTQCLRDAEANEKMIRLPTGDGIVLISSAPPSSRSIVRSRLAPPCAIVPKSRCGWEFTAAR